MNDIQLGHRRDDSFSLLFYPHDMDPSKLPLEKLAFFVVGIVPGAMAIYIYYLANPTAFHRFLMPNEFGYGAKLGIGIGLSFVIGNTLTSFIFAIGGAIGGALGALWKTPEWPTVLESAPWRDPKWRKLTKRYLGNQVPDDTFPIPDEIFKIRMSSLSMLPEPEQAQAQFELIQEAMKLASDDGEWGHWYAQIGAQQRAEMSREFTNMFSDALRANLQATALYLLIAMCFVPRLRNWICICFSVGWLIMMFAEGFVSIRGIADPWKSWFDQVSFLSRKAVKTGEPERPTDQK